MVRARLRMKTVRLSSRPAKLDTVKMKTAALENFRLDLRNQFEGLQLDEDASPEHEWREVKVVVADAYQAHLGRMPRLSRDWVTGETIVLAEQACLARMPRAPSHRNLIRQTTTAHAAPQLL